MQKSAFKWWLQKRGGWLCIFVLSLFPIVTWLLIDSHYELFGSLNGVVRIMAKLGGLTGLVLYAISLLLATRAKWLENFFDGLNRVYAAHHITGGLSLILLTIHPIFLSLKYLNPANSETLRQAASALLPRPIQTNTGLFDTLQDVSVNLGIISYFMLVSLLILTLYIKLPYKYWLLTHKFLGLAFLFGGIHTLLINTPTARNPVLKIYFLIWICIGVASYIYRSVAPNILVKREKYKVSRVTSHEGSVVEIALLPVSGKIAYKPGQFIFVEFLHAKSQHIEKEYHPFSVVSSPSEPEIRLMVKNLGDLTSRLKDLAVGTEALIEGAFGTFGVVRHSQKRQLWIAGGIGITPFLSMARSTSIGGRDVSLVYSVVNRAELLDVDHLKSLSANANFKFFDYVQDEKENKFIDADYIEGVHGGFDNTEVFMCGPPGMIMSLNNQLIKKGIPKSCIHSEEFSMP